VLSLSDLSDAAVVGSPVTKNNINIIKKVNKITKENLVCKKLGFQVISRLFKPFLMPPAHLEKLLIRAQLLGLSLIKIWANKLCSIKKN
jgi:hypothetical protein